MLCFSGCRPVISVFCRRFGGFDGKPKFPTPVVFGFLSHVHCRLLERVRKSAREFSTDSVMADDAPNPKDFPRMHADMDLPKGDPTKEVRDLPA